MRKALLVVLLTLTGCAAQPEILTDPERINAALRERGLNLNRVVYPFLLNVEMRAWARRMTSESRNSEERLEHLQAGLLNPEEVQIEYAWGYTGTAIEVFEQRKANCLAFTNLFVAMAREVGLPVYFLGVNNIESYRKEGDLVVVSDHIAVGHGVANDRKIFDFSQNPPDDYRHFKRVSDLTAIAMYHSNRGAEALQLGATEDSIDWLKLSVRIDPELANGWVNLGVAYRRQGDHAAAEEAYRKALDLDPQTFSAYQNLASLLRLRGREKEARAYEAMLATAPNRNPYSYLTLGDISLLGGRVNEAEKLYRRAVRLDDRSVEAYAALGKLAMNGGDERKARKLLKKALKIKNSGDPEVEGEHPRLRQLEKALGGG